MRTRVIVVITVLAAIAAAGFAEGNREQVERPYGPGYRWSDASRQSLELTGKVSLKEDFHPVLDVSGTKYALMVPGWRWLDVDVSEGQTVTVRGYSVEGAPCDGDEEAAVFVTSAVIDGKEYQAPDGPGFMMGRGGRVGMMGWYGDGRPNNGRYNGPARGGRPMGGPGGRWR